MFTLLTYLNRFPFIHLDIIGISAFDYEVSFKQWLHFVELTKEFLWCL